MCRYFSGFFYHHPLLADVDYYWRIEPDVHYYCDLNYDPFVFMQQRCACPCATELHCAGRCAASN